MRFSRCLRAFLFCFRFAQFSLPNYSELYSYGSRIIASSLHLTEPAASGTLTQREPESLCRRTIVERRPPTAPPMRKEVEHSIEQKKKKEAETQLLLSRKDVKSRSDAYFSVSRFSSPSPLSLYLSQHIEQCVPMITQRVRRAKSLVLRRVRAKQRSRCSPEGDVDFRRSRVQKTMSLSG